VTIMLAVYLMLSNQESDILVDGWIAWSASCDRGEGRDDGVCNDCCGQVSLALAFCHGSEQLVVRSGGKKVVQLMLSLWIFL